MVQVQMALFCGEGGTAMLRVEVIIGMIRGRQRGAESHCMLEDRKSD